MATNSWQKEKKTGYLIYSYETLWGGAEGQKPSHHHTAAPPTVRKHLPPASVHSHPWVRPGVPAHSCRSLSQCSTAQVWLHLHETVSAPVNHQPGAGINSNLFFPQTFDWRFICFCMCCSCILLALFGPSDLISYTVIRHFLAVRLPAARAMNFDKILSAIGGFGKFQKILYVWICLPQIFLAFHMLVSVFTGAVPPHLCRLAGPSAATPASSNFSLLTTPDGQPDLSCPVPLNHSTSVSPGSGHPTVSCQEGWEYSTETFENTIVTEVSEKTSSLSDKPRCVQHAAMECGGT